MFANWRLLLLLWLERHGPYEWHHVAVNWNWNNDPPPLVWIIRQPDCDLATAAYIFQMCQSGDYLVEWTKDVAAKQSWFSRLYFDLSDEIVDRAWAGQYRSHLGLANPPNKSIEFGLTPWHERKLPKPVPACLCERLEGELVEQSVRYSDGFPQELEPIFDEMKRNGWLI